MPIKLFITYKAPTQLQEHYDWFHRTSAKFRLCYMLLISEILLHWLQRKNGVLGRRFNPAPECFEFFFWDDK